MSNTFNNFLRQYYTDDMYHTHVSMIQPRGKFIFNRSEINGLYKAYRGSRESKGIAEKSQHYIPIIVDIDLFVSNSTIKNLYTIDDVKSVIQVYNEVILSTISNISPENLICVFLSKDPYINSHNNKLKHGFHLHYPKIFIDKTKFETILFPKIEKLIKERNILIKFPNSNDKAVSKVPWLMYGSVKEEGYQPYLVDKIFDNNLQEMSLNDAFIDYKLYNEDEKVIKIVNKIELYLPNILSIFNYGRECYIFEVKDQFIEQLSPRIESVEERDGYSTDLVLSEEQVNRIDYYLGYIKKDYIEDTKKWFVMYNLLKYLQVDDEKILEICSRTTIGNYNEETMTKSLERWNIEQFLNYGKNSTLTSDQHIENLRKMTIIKKGETSTVRSDGKEKSSEEYTILQHEDVAILFIEHFGSDYKITSADGGGYKYSDEYKLWIYSETSFFVDISRLLGIVIGSKNNKNIKTVGFMKSVWNIVYIKLYNRDFLEQVDKSPYELPIKGGKLINLKSGSIRDRRKTDLWSFELNFNIVDDTTKAEEYIETLFDSIQVRDFIKKLLGYFSTGSVAERKGYFFVGEGRNGKSLLQNILTKVFKGSRFVNSLMKSVLIKSNNHHSNGPTPELGPLQYSRMGFTCELDKEDKLDDNKFKSITGSDDITHRPMYLKGEPLIFKTSCKLICSTNEMPTFGVNQQAIQDRIVIIEFKKRFEDSVENRIYAEYLESPEFIEIFGSYIIKGAIEYCNSSLIYPNEVLSYTKSVFNERDTIGSFINEKCMLEEQQFIVKNILYNNYTNYCVQDGKKFETKDVFCKYLKKLSLKTKQKTINGRREEIFIGIGEI